MKKPLKENMEGSVREVEFTNMRDKLRDAMPPVQQVENGAELRRDLGVVFLAEQDVDRVAWQH